MTPFPARSRAWLAVGAMMAGPIGGGAAGANDGTEGARERMVAEIVAMARATGAETGRPRFADAVIAAMREIPRHRFVSGEQAVDAYRNHPLPIGAGQTISQPYIVALSTDLIDPKPGDRVLEIGTGSGYQAAVLARLVREVWSVEIVPSLAREAEERLRVLGYPNVRVRLGDGHEGWPEHAPYDAIVVTAAASEIPRSLVEQLKPGGRMVIPVGAPGGVQDLVLVERRADGGQVRRVVLQVRFVPMVRSP